MSHLAPTSYSDLSRLEVAIGGSAQQSAGAADRAATAGVMKVPADGAVVSQLRHDIRTPLNVIRGYARLLVDREGLSLTDTQLRFARNIFAATEDLERILDTSRMPSEEVGV